MSFWNAKIIKGSLITRGTIITSLLLLLAGNVLGLALHGWNTPLDYHSGSGWQAYLGLGALAAAIERLIQPFSDVLGDAPMSGAQILVQNTLTPTGAQPNPKSNQNTAIVTWGLASGLGSLTCAVLGIGLIASMLGNDTTPITPWLDILLSGLVIGAATKPLHDIVTSVQATKALKQSQLP